MESALPPTESLKTTPASLAFLRRLPAFQSEKPYYISHSLPPEFESRRTNLEFEVHAIFPHNLKGHENSLSIEKDGIQFLDHESVTEAGTNRPHYLYGLQ
jgi:hypothetical protein